MLKENVLKAEKKIAFINSLNSQKSGSPLLAFTVQSNSTLMCLHIMTHSLIFFFHRTPALFSAQCSVNAAVAQYFSLSSCFIYYTSSEHCIEYRVTCCLMGFVLMLPKLVYQCTVRIYEFMVTILLCTH